MSPRQLTPFLCAGVVALTGCAGLSKKNRPIDINKDMPKVSVVLEQVQAAIDATAASWQAQTGNAEANKACTTANDVAASACIKANLEARDSCRNEKGATAQVLCSDHLRVASLKCKPPGWTAQECAYASSFEPIRITSAKFEFTAVSGVDAGGEVSMKLVSAKIARKAGRGSSYVIEMVPRPDKGKAAFSTNLDGQQAALATNLEAVLMVALRAASTCGASNTPEKPLVCTSAGVPELVFKKATYSVDLTYEATNGVGFKWSASPLKLADGTFAAGSGNKLGNVLTIELER